MAQVSAERSNVVTTSTLFEAIAGVAAIVLAILGLTHILPRYMAAIGTVVVGAALVEGNALGARARALHGQPSAEVLAGAAGMVLGVLALLGLSDMILLPAAVIVFGASLLIAGFTGSRPVLRPARPGVTERVPMVDPSAPVNPATAYVEPPTAELAAEPVEMPTGAQLLIGLAALVLGVLALLGHSPLILILVALLCVGCAELLTGAVLSVP
jgi:hypothetical protein